MKDMDERALPVGDTDRPVGILTDRGIAIWAVAEGKRGGRPVRDAMTPEIHGRLDGGEVDAVAGTRGELEFGARPCRTATNAFEIIAFGDEAQRRDGHADTTPSDIARRGGRPAANR